MHLERAEIEKVRAATQTTFNDVLLTLTGSVLRTHLADLGALPDRQLTAMVPVSVRDDDTPADDVNRLSGLIVGLATTVADPLDRLHAVRDGFGQAEEQDALLGPDMLSSFAELAVPCVLGPAMGAFTRLGVSCRWPMFNVVVSSYPGSPVPLYCVGGRMAAYHPFGPIVDGAALNVTAMSYLDQVGIGLLACKRAGPRHRRHGQSLPRRPHRAGEGRRRLTSPLRRPVRPPRLPAPGRPLTSPRPWFRLTC